MTERQRKIIQVIVNEYLHTGTPIGSSFLVDRFSMPMSSATVRKEMSVLEQMGYLMSPHTSAGRIPTDSAFELYAKSVIELFEITNKQKERLDEFYNKNYFELEQLFQNTAEILSFTSQSMSVVLSPVVLNSILQRVELVHIYENQVLMVVVSGSGTIFQKHLQLNQPLHQEELYKISRFLNQNLKGYEISDLQEKGLNFLSEEHSFDNDILSTALQVAQALIYNPPEQQIFTDGKELFFRQLLDYTQDKPLVEKIVQTINEKGFLCDLFNRVQNKVQVTAQFGLEIDGQRISGISLLSVPYFIGGRKVGSLGVLGLSRMPYDKIIPTLEYTSRILSNVLKERNEFDLQKDIRSYPIEVRNRTTVIKLEDYKGRL